MNFNIYGDSQLEQLTKEIDTLVKTSPIRDSGVDNSESASSNLISQFLSTEDQLTSEKSLKNNPFYKYSLENKSGISEISSLLDKLSIAPEREQRYRVYDELYNSCPMIKKMVSVWINNLFQKNPVSGKSLLIKEKADDDDTDASSVEDDYENKIKMSEIFIDEILDYFELVDKLKHKIVPYQLQYGDAFLEVIDLKKYDPTKSDDRGGQDLFLSESSIISNNTQNKSFYGSNDAEIIENINKKIDGSKTISENTLNEIIDVLSDIFIDPNYRDKILDENEALNFSNKDRSIVLHERSEKDKPTSSYEAFYEYYQSQYDGSMKSKLIHRKNKKIKKSNLNENSELLAKYMNKKLDLSDIMVLVHHPKNIVILSTTYGSKLGYVEVTEKEDIQTTNIGQQLSSIVGRLVTVGGKNINSSEEIVGRIIKTVIRKIIQAENKSKSTSLEKAINSLDSNTLNTIKRLIIETYKQDTKIGCRKLKARFIPIDRVFHFTVKASDYSPYGTSIIDSLVLQGKLYMLSQLSNIIMKLSRAAPMRKWIIDVGPLQDQSSYVQQIKRELYNQRVTLADIMSFKSAPKLLSDFKDMFTFRKNGNSHLDMELQSLGDAK